MRYSKQREEILKVVLDSCDHPSVDVIYERVRKVIPNISLGTVYRNLTALHETGQIYKISTPSGKDHYDKTLYDHAHIYCNKCLHVIDLEISIFDEVKEKVEYNNKCRIITSNIIFTGICKKCLEGEK